MTRFGAHDMFVVFRIPSQLRVRLSFTADEEVIVGEWYQWHAGRRS